MLKWRHDKRTLIAILAIGGFLYFTAPNIAIIVLKIFLIGFFTLVIVEGILLKLGKVQPSDDWGWSAKGKLIEGICGVVLGLESTILNNLGHFPKSVSLFFSALPFFALIGTFYGYDLSKKRPKSEQ